VLITIGIALLLLPNSRLVLCWIFSYDSPKIRNLPKIFLRSFENVSPGIHKGHLWICTDVFWTRRLFRWWKSSGRCSASYWRSVVSWHHRAGNWTLWVVDSVIRHSSNFNAPTPLSMTTHCSCSKVKQRRCFDLHKADLVITWAVELTRQLNNTLH